MYCTSCGRRIADDTTLCPYCGRSVPQSDALAELVAAQGSGTAGTGVGEGAVAGEAAAGAAIAGEAAAAGILGALKIGLIALAAVTVVGLGVFGVPRIVLHSTEPQEVSVMEDVNGQKDPEELETSWKLETPWELETSEESGIPGEPDPVDEAMEQYRIIISQADNYEYSEYETDSPWFELAGYRYALVQMQPDDLVPTLLLEMEGRDTENSVLLCYARVFQYDPDTQMVRQPTEAIGDGGIRGGLSMAGDGYGILSTGWSGGTGEGSVTRITLDGDSLKKDICWTGQIFDMPESITFHEIEWHESGDLAALDSWTAPDPGGAEASEPVDGGTLPTDGDRIVLTGTVGTYDYDGIVELQGQPDPNGWDENSVEYSRSMTYRVIVLDTPQTLRLHSGGGDDYFSNEASMINLYYVDGMEQYEGQHITFSIDPDNTHWPSDTSLPFGQPFARDIHVLE